MKTNIKKITALMIKRRMILSGFFIFMLFIAANANALPVTGYYVSEIDALDTLMQEFMTENNLTAGVLGVSKDSRIIYQRGFGYAYNGIDPLPENATMRVASVSKPFAAAAIRYLIADGTIGLDDFVFDLDQELAPGQRALLDATPSGDYSPYDGNLGDDRFDEITIEHLLFHLGGWDRDVFDPMYEEEDIGIATGHVPPGRQWTVKYTLSQPLQYTPGVVDPSTGDRYCNFGYMLLSLIVEQETGWPYTAYLRHRVLTTEMWVPITEILSGATFETARYPREPRYKSIYGCVNVYNPTGSPVWCPYGSFDLEQKTGEGNLVSSAAALLTLLHNYQVRGSNLGMPLTSYFTHWKDGRFYHGTSTMIHQWSDGFSVVLLFNQGDEHYAHDLVNVVHDTPCYTGYYC